MMSSTEKHVSAESSWRQLEEFVDRLHELAQSVIEPDEFYHQVLEQCVTTLAANGGAVWLPKAGGTWYLAHQSNLPEEVRQSSAIEQHYSLLHRIAASDEIVVLQPHSGISDQPENPTDSILIASAISTPESSHGRKPQAILELYMRTGASPAVQQGWQEMLATVSQIAGNFHIHNQLRFLQAEQGLHDQSLSLLRRIHHPTNLRKTAFEIVNEGRRFVDCDRLSLILQRGRAWHVAAVSGVDRVESRGDAAKRLTKLAKSTAHWGEPLDTGDLDQAADSELPPALSRCISEQLDHSHARRLIAVPIEFRNHSDSEHSKSATSSPTAVLIAEQFTNIRSGFSCQRVAELAQLCEPSLHQAIRLDRFPARFFLRWSNRLSPVRPSRTISRLALATLITAAAIAALIFVQIDFEIEAPATLMPNVERDVFATADGTIDEVMVSHGQEVAAGDALAQLDDPQLALDTQQVVGEMATVRKQLEAIAVARTDRIVQAETDRNRLPLSAEAQQLEKQLESLQRQREILATRRESLTMRSPIAGTVLTLDVQKLLRTRPVERGQLLFKIADVNSGWWLQTEVDQDRIGHILAAQQSSESQLTARIRFAGDESNTFTGQLESISATAVLDPNELAEAASKLRVRVTIDEHSLPAARPGMTAKVRILCGQRSLGYVWLHDAWETVYSWVVF